MSVATAIKIKKIREFKNFTQGYMAGKLGLSQNSYSRIESGQTKLDTDRLKEISKLLDVPVETILSDESNVFNFTNNSGVSAGYYIGQDETKELTLKTIKLLEEKVALLENEVERLRNTSQ